MKRILLSNEVVKQRHIEILIILPHLYTSKLQPLKIRLTRTHTRSL